MLTVSAQSASYLMSLAYLLCGVAMGVGVQASDVALDCLTMVLLLVFQLTMWSGVGV